MSEIPSSKVNFQVSDSIFKWERQREIALFEKNILPRLKTKAKNLSQALDSYKKGDIESYTKLTDILSEIRNL